MTMIKFRPEGITTALMNRIYRDGVAVAVYVDKAENKGEQIDTKLLEDLEADYMLSCYELNGILLSELAQGNPDPWRTFAKTYDDIKEENKLLYRGVLRDVKQAASNVLSKSAKPFDSVLPPEIIGPTVPEVFEADHPLWKDVFNEAEAMTARSKSTAADFTTGIGAVAAGAHMAAGGAAILSAAGAGAVALVAAGAYTAGEAVGTAIRDYMRD